MHLRPVNTLLFFFNDTATTEIYTLSLHDALPISLLRLARSDERAHECTIQGGRQGVDIEAGASQELPGVLHAIDAGGLDLDVHEARRRQLGPVLRLVHGAGHASDPELHAAADLRP